MNEFDLNQANCHEDSLVKRYTAELSNNLNPTPLITVITVSFNAVNVIEKSISSVISQSYTNIEYIVIDGQSTDGTLDVLKRYESKIDYLVSEKDCGIYDAMNKAIDNSTGEWLYFLGADDHFSDQYVIGDVVREVINSKLKLNLVFGNVKTDDGKLVKSIFGAKLLLHNCLHHQSCFYSRDLFDGFRYDISNKIISDYELNLMSYIEKKNALKVDRVIAVCCAGGISNNKENYCIHINETNSIRKRHVNVFFNIVLQAIFNAKALIHYVIRYF